MSRNSQETLRKVTQDDPSLTESRLIKNNAFLAKKGDFYSDIGDAYSTLGAAIANNTHLERLTVWLSDGLPLTVANREFFDGLHRNTSISNLELWCNSRNIAGGVAHEILRAYQENNNHLTVLSIKHANLQNGGDRVIMDTLRRCSNLQRVTLYNCNITDEQLLPIVDAIRGHRPLEELQLYGNNIGNAGCEALATLLADPNCNLSAIGLGNNAIDNEGATTIANSLTNNNQLQKLFLDDNPIDPSVDDKFCRALCNKTSINDIYSSNHTLNVLLFNHDAGRQLESLLELNECDTKSYVAIRKILKYHPNIDMEPFFEWGMEEEGEHTLKALPYVMGWFERAEEAVADDDESSNSEGGGYNVTEQKLSAIYDFSRAMPLLLEGISSMNVDSKKRKRSDRLW